VLACFVLCACTTTPDSSDLGNAGIVSTYVAAYNDHDIERMLGMVTDDIRWMSVEKNNVAVITEGKLALASALADYFTGLPSASSRIRYIQANGTFVSVIEEAIWASRGETRSQCALAVYEFDASLITNVWYYSGEPCHGLR